MCQTMPLFFATSSAENHLSLEKRCHGKTKSIDMDVFRDDVASSQLCTQEFTDLEERVGCYNTTLALLLVRHAPVLTKTVVRRRCDPWFNNDISLAIRARRAAERKWRRSKIAQDITAFKAARNPTNYIMSAARKEYLSDFILQNSGNQAKLF